MGQDGARRRPRRIGFWYRLAAVILRPLFMTLTKRDWHGAENLPATGGVIVVTNHVSHVDPITFAHFLFDNGFLPRFLAKEVLFRVFFVGQVLKGAKQIPVYRESEDASRAYSAAVEAVRDGECVAFYPEATLTRDPDQWPMVGKTGAARVALETGAPWGPQELLAPYAKRPHLLPRKTMHMRAGPPVDISDLAGRPIDGPLLREVTERLMAAITSLLEEIRGERAPITRFDPRSSQLPRTGDPNRPRRAS
jgi:1-acyl-sn-glycerol-3-phosphate acyltransferase